MMPISAGRAPGGAMRGILTVAEDEIKMDIVERLLRYMQ
jgi:hypothetical protein